MSGSSAAAVLRTEHLGRRVQDRWIVNDVSLEVQKTELLGIVGPSGSGKSSLLRLLDRLDEPTTGTVFLEDRDYRQIPPRQLRQRIGMVTQRPFLFPGDVAANLSFGPAQRGEVLPHSQIAELLVRVGLPDFAGRDVANLSGGEQQRVSLARALANRPELLLLDEPTSALDEQSKLGIEQLVRSLVTDHSYTFILVTHDREQARRICDRVVVMETGKVLTQGTPSEVLRA